MTPLERYQKLEQLLSNENPVLLDIIEGYKQLDTIGYRTGLLSKNESYAEQISWWPLISILGTFSAGKSSFINSYVGQPMQTTGNQAIDDKFTVICHGSKEGVVTLPGLALDSDPRFPFYGMSEQIEQVESGEGNRIDSYLQLKTAHANNLRGKILIDSPGFDADAQRDSTLRLTKHIIDLSDLVLVFFDARHPEPGAMRDTLEHLVSTTRKRHDSDKILYILNQIDTAAKEDNLEEIIASWQRALSSQGLVGGNFYAIYNDAAAEKFTDEAVEKRFQRRRDQDLERIAKRMDKVSIERSYRIARSLETIRNEITLKQLPDLQQHLEKWKKQVLIADGAVFGGFSILLLTLLSQLGAFESPVSDWALITTIVESSTLSLLSTLLIVGSVMWVHKWLRDKLADRIKTKLLKDEQDQLAKAFMHNTPFWRSIFSKQPRGWGRRSQKTLQNISQVSKKAIQKLNDQFTNPSGEKEQQPTSEVVSATENSK